MLSLKLESPVEVLGQEEFQVMLKYVRGLDLDEKPQYGFLRE
jgi:hypothetical protein